MRSTALIVAALLVCLPGCAKPVTVRQPVLVGSSLIIQSSLARVCPKPTTNTNQAKILVELEALDSSGELAKVDTLATEWDRLNEGARACRGRQPWR